MRKYALHDTVHELLSSFAAQPNGSILITGKKGSGLSMAIAYVVNSVYGNNVERAGEVIRLEDASISGVRDVLGSISRTRVNTQKPRLVIIDDAQRLSVESQNVLLKSLEEPPQNTHFVLATSSPDILLGTIKSRTHEIKLKRPPKNDLRKIFESYADAEFDQAYMIADGWPGSLRSILEDPESDISKQVASAKQFLSSDTESRIVSLKNKDTSDLRSLTEGLLRISTSTMRLMAQKGSSEHAKKWQSITSSLLEFEKELDAGLGAKIATLRLSTAF